MSTRDFTVRLQALLDQHQAGNGAARDALIGHALDRLRHLARRMFRRHSDLRAFDQTDDVVQQTLLRLHRALSEVRPATPREFFGLAARQVRWVLHDLARKHAPHKRLAYADHAGDERPDRSGEPADLLEWADFHQRIDGLPDEAREMFDLLFYQGLSQADAAALLGTSVRTVKRRWQQARVLLHDALRGDWPDT